MGVNHYYLPCFHACFAEQVTDPRGPYKCKLQSPQASDWEKPPGVYSNSQSLSLKGNIRALNVRHRSGRFFRVESSLCLTAAICPGSQPRKEYCPETRKSYGPFHQL